MPRESFKRERVVMNNKQWMKKYSASAHRFHYGDGGRDLREYLVEYLSEAILSLRGRLSSMGEDEERTARIRMARMAELKRTLTSPSKRDKKIKRANPALVAFRAEQAQESANVYGSWERENAPFLDFEKFPGIPNTGEKARVQSGHERE